MIAIKVEPSDSIAHVKVKIYKKERLPPDQQRLFFAGNEMDDDLTLRNYKVKEEKMIVLILVKFQILNLRMLSGRIMTITVHQDDNIADVKDKFQAEEGIPPEQQRIFFAGHQLEDWRKLSLMPKTSTKEMTLNLVLMNSELEL